jgi:hypothetical protein
MTVTCTHCDEPYEANADGRHNHKILHGHAPSTGRKEG